MSRIEVEDAQLETDAEGFLVDIKGHSTRWKASEVTFPPARGVGLHSFSDFRLEDHAVLVGSRLVDGVQCYEAVLLIRGGRIADVRSVIYLIL